MFENARFYLCMVLRCASQQRWFNLELSVSRVMLVTFLLIFGLLDNNFSFHLVVSSPRNNCSCSPLWNGGQWRESITQPKFESLPPKWNLMKRSDRNLNVHISRNRFKWMIRCYKLINYGNFLKLLLGNSVLDKFKLMFWWTRLED